METLRPLEWELIVTDGDYITESTKPRPVPGTKLLFELPEARQVHFTLQAAAAYWPALIGMQVDADVLVFMHIHIFEYPIHMPAIYQIAVLEAEHVLGPGVHAVEVIAAAIGKGIPAGPKEWSPRKTGPGPKACIMKSPERPLVLSARTVA